MTYATRWSLCFWKDKVYLKVVGERLGPARVAITLEHLFARFAVNAGSCYGIDVPVSCSILEEGRMEVSIYFKLADYWEHYMMEEDEFQRLQDDFEKYLQGVLAGGVYTLAPQSMNGGYQKARKVPLRFDQIQFK